MTEWYTQVALVNKTKLAGQIDELMDFKLSLNAPAKSAKASKTKA